MGEELRSILLGTAGLSLAAMLALYLTVARGNLECGPEQLRSSCRLVLIGVLFQAAHFIEELATGFYERFPELLGLSAWSLEFFVVFNVSWLAAWILAALGVAARIHVALFPVWFLGIGCVANAVAHPLFSVLTGGYFPGLVTSPLVGVVGVLILRRMARGSRAPATTSGAPVV